MTRMPCSGGRLAVQRLHPHPLYQRAHMSPDHLETSSVELIAQHARSHERMIQMQFINPAHQPKLSLALRSVTKAVPANSGKFRLTLDEQGGVVTAEHRFALINPALMGAPSKTRSPAPVA